MTPDDSFDDDDDEAAAGAGGADDRPSKTQRKKAMLALQALGQRLVALPESRLKSVPLDDDLRDAVQMARGIRSHEGRRRQLQYIGRLMRSADAAAIEASLAGDDEAHAHQVAAHHAAEQWRDGLIDGSRRITDFLGRFPRAAALPRATESRRPLENEDSDHGAADDDEATASLPEARGRRRGGRGAAPAPNDSPLSAAALTNLVDEARAVARDGGTNPRHARALYRALYQWLTAFERPDR